jgi:hypothetical protein
LVVRFDSSDEVFFSEEKGIEKVDSQVSDAVEND